MAFGIGDAIGIGASIAGGLFGDDANEDAAKDIARANAETQKMIRGQQFSNDNAFKPYTNVGELANQRLAQYLGIDVYAPGGYLGDYIIIDDEGNFRQNDRLAQISPEYAKAYNDFVATHQAKYGTSANLDKNSIESMAEAFIRGRIDPSKIDAQARTLSEAFRNDPTYGSLLAKFSENDLNNDVVYKTGLEFGLNEGIKGLNRRAASGGSYDSGATLKALTRYANDYGTTKAEGAYGRFMNDKNTTYGFLSGQQGVGLAATDRNQSLNTGLLGQAVGANMGAAGAQAQYGLEGAAALNNGIMGGIGNWLYSRRMGSGGSPGIAGGTYGGGGSSGGVNLSGYTSSIPWYA